MALDNLEIIQLLFCHMTMTKITNQTKHTMLHETAKLNLTQSLQQSEQDVINDCLGGTKRGVNAFFFCTNQQ